MNQQQREAAQYFHNRLARNGKLTPQERDAYEAFLKRRAAEFDLTKRGWRSTPPSTRTGDNFIIKGALGAGVLEPAQPLSWIPAQAILTAVPCKNPNHEPTILFSDTDGGLVHCADCRKAWSVKGRDSDTGFKVESVTQHDSFRPGG